MLREVVHLPVLQPDVVTRVEDRFRCDVYSAVIPVRTCLGRRSADYVGGRSQHAPPERYAAFPACARCPVGALIESRVASTAAPKQCAVPGCKALARRGTHCTRHLRSAVVGRLSVPSGGHHG